MEIEVGEHIRDKEGNITKIQNILSLDKEVYLFLGEDGYQYSDNSISKHSKNIIDLIEVGDIIEVQTGLYNKYKIIIEDEDTLISTQESLKNQTINSILTKEQFEQNCYRLEE